MSKGISSLPGIVLHIHNSFPRYMPILSFFFFSSSCLFIFPRPFYAFPMLLMLPAVIICPLFLFIMHAYVPLYVQVLDITVCLWI